MAQLPNMDDDAMYKWSKRVEPKDNEVSSSSSSSFSIFALPLSFNTFS